MRILKLKNKGLIATGLLITGILLMSCDSQNSGNENAGSSLSGYGPNTNDERFVVKARPTDTKFNAIAKDLFTGQTFVQQSTSESEAIKAALKLCKDRTSTSGENGGCVIVKQFVAQLLPRIDGDLPASWACKAGENRPIADQAVNRNWGAGSDQDLLDACKKALRRCAKKSGIQCRVVSTINTDYEKSTTLIHENRKDRPKE